MSGNFIGSIIKQVSPFNYVGYYEALYNILTTKYQYSAILRNDKHNMKLSNERDEVENCKLIEISGENFRVPTDISVCVGHPSCNAMLTCKQIPMIQRNMLHPSSGLKIIINYVHSHEKL